MKKNGLPCVAELCIGDGLEELRKVEWERAKPPFSTSREPVYAGAKPLTEYEKNDVNVNFRGRVTAAAPYLAVGAFDGKAIDLLAGVTTACAQRELVGRYTTESGNPTRVNISLVPDRENPAVQRWMVVSIMREFPAAKSIVQQTEVQQELEARYGKFKHWGRARSVTAIFRTDIYYTGTVRLHLSAHGEVKGSHQYMLHPLCGGAKRIAVD